MAHRGINLRVAVIAVAILMSISYGVVATSGPRYVIQIDFGMYPEDLEGTEVVIDGEVVGSLTRRGARTLTGFRVEEGVHVVSLKHATLASEPVELTSGFGAGQLRLMVDLEERFDGTRSEPVLVLR